jgi:DNA modification methylase
VKPYYDDGACVIYHGRSEDVLATWPAESVDAIVTSPEYADQRKYVSGPMAGPGSYAEAFRPHLAAMLRVLRPEGSLMLNLGVVLRDGEETPYADDVLAVARAMGWKLLHRMIWQKSNPLPLSHPAFLTVAHEWVFWLAPTVKAYRGYDRDTRRPHSAASIRRIGQPYMRGKDERYARRGQANALHPDGAKPTTVFTCAVGSRRGIKHPAPMPLRLAAHLVSLSCPPGGLVLDPFAGSGTTLLAARQRGRRAVGIDMEADYCAEAAAALAAPHQEGLALETPA